MKPDDLTSYEREVLAMLAGTGPDLPWGAAMSVALETLSSRGLATPGPHYKATPKGLHLLKTGEA